jgi:trans-aconitate 2-methyltransferase
MVGVDSSAEMVRKASQTVTAVRFVQNAFEESKSYMASFESPPAYVDLIFSNAAFHWTRNHERLLPSLIQLLNPGTGVLAFSIPDTRVQTSHVLMKRAAHECGFTQRLESTRIPQCELDPTEYHNILCPHSDLVDIWVTTYYQVFNLWLFVLS